MYRKAKLGVIVPSANTAMEYELYRMAPPNISIHFARMKLTEDTPEQIAGCSRYVPKAVDELADAKVDVIAFGCTGGSFIKGVGYDKEIISIIQKQVKIPATTTSTAVIRALEVLKAKKVVVGSPYEDWLNEKLKIFLEGHGFDVIKIKGLGVIKDIAEIPDNVKYKLAKEIYSPEADVMFFSCTDFMVAHLISPFEEDFGIPVITSNQATLWDMLRIIGLKTRVKGYGILLEKY
mgnify:CR=1 FL=1